MKTLFLLFTKTQFKTKKKINIPNGQMMFIQHRINVSVT